MEEEIKLFEEDVKVILQPAGFELQKIHSNVARGDDQDQERQITEIKTLGLRWNPRDDCLRYHSSYEASSKQLTKRIILSMIAQIFHLLGLIGPFVIRSRVMLQHLWKLKIGWDSTIPEDVANRWTTYCNQLKNIDQISIPRHVLAQSPQNVQVHGFSDASEVAYGACIYLRSVNLDGSIMIRLLCARSRVAPIKSLSLPRLALCGSLILAILYEKVKGSIRVDVEESYFWSDFMITLAWIKGEPSLWHTFVGNRVSEVQ